jgi:hypothetical protein
MTAAIVFTVRYGIMFDRYEDTEHADAALPAYNPDVHPKVRRTTPAAAAKGLTVLVDPETIMHVDATQPGHSPYRIVLSGRIWHEDDVDQEEGTIGWGPPRATVVVDPRDLLPVMVEAGQAGSFEQPSDHLRVHSGDDGYDRAYPGLPHGFVPR